MSPRGGHREGAGRKPTRDETARCTVQVRVTDAEKRVMTEAAARAGKTVSEWLRKLGIDAAMR